MRPRSALALVALTLSFQTASAAADSHASAPPAAHTRAARTGAVFTMTNEAEGNRVAAFLRAADGSLAEPVFTATGGRGTGSSLGSQGALTLSESGRFLLVVNAGSNDLSVFAVRGSELTLVQRVPTRGTRPISVSERSGIVYVLNAGDTGNIQGFWLGLRGELFAIPGSMQKLSGDATNPAQLSLTPGARDVVVTEKATQSIDVFHLTLTGRASPARVFHAAGSTPFGFDVTDDAELVVSEAGAGGLSAYDLDFRGDLRLINGPVSDTQAAACWVAISPDNRVAFTANAGSASVSSYSVDRHGRIALQSAVAGDVGEGGVPLDLDFDRSGAHLYVLNRGHRSIEAFDVEGAALSPLDTAGALPAFTTGIAVY